VLASCHATQIELAQTNISFDLTRLAFVLHLSRGVGTNEELNEESEEREIDTIEIWKPKCTGTVRRTSTTVVLE
jgi:hypothetical protein